MVARESREASRWFLCNKDLGWMAGAVLGTQEARMVFLFVKMAVEELPLLADREDVPDGVPEWHSTPTTMGRAKGLSEEGRETLGHSSSGASSGLMPRIALLAS